MDGISLPRLSAMPHGANVVAALGVAIGAVAGWHYAPEYLPFALALPAAWGYSSTRLWAGLSAFTYMLLAAIDLPAGAAVFFGTSGFVGWVLLIGVALLFAVPFVILWSPHISLVRAAALLCLITLPPIGIFGWANPLTAAGALFPGMGWIGLAATAGLFLVIARWPGVFLLIILITLLLPPVEPAAPDGWEAINTAYAMSSDETRAMPSAKRQQEIIQRVFESDARVVVLPESVAGRWTYASMFLWGDLARTAREKDQVVLIGAELPAAGGYTNSVIALDVKAPAPVYHQLMPVPIAMWKPWDREGAIAHWFYPQSAIIDGQRAAFLICYEQLLVWPVIAAMGTSPDVLIGLSNDWWARETRIPMIQHQVIQAWANLFGTQLIYAVNQ